MVNLVRGRECFVGLVYYYCMLQIFHEGGHDWKLQIQYTRQQDEGLYECRVSSRVPLVFYTFLHVVGKQTQQKQYLNLTV